MKKNKHFIFANSCFPAGIFIRTALNAS